MIMHNQRGAALSTAAEGSWKRRVRQLPRQAGSPESSTSCECSTSLAGSVRKGLACLGYAIRKSQPLRDARRVFYSLVAHVPTKRDRRRPKDPLRRRPLAFVSGGQLSDYAPADVAMSRPPARQHSLAPLMRARSTPWIGFDHRTRGTFLEAPIMRDFWRIRDEAIAAGRKYIFKDSDVERFENDSMFSTWLHYGGKPTYHVRYLTTKGNLPGLYTTKISTYELSRALHHDRESKLSVSAMVHEHLLGLAEFLPDIDGDLGELLLTSF